MSPINPSTACLRASRRGFALVITLSLMILLTVIAVGLLTLSSISLRSSGQGEAMATARANARMALMLAIGELQRNAGPDTRVTARADVLNENNPPVLGAWKSWEGADHETSGPFVGRPVSPGNYKSEKENRFQGWLVSGQTAGAPGQMPDTTAGAKKAVLVGKESVGSGADRENLQIHLTPSEVARGTLKGSFAWWVGGENAKARLPKPYQPQSDSAAGWAVQAKSHAVADPSALRLSKVITDPVIAERSLTLGQANLSSDSGALKVSQEFFHDLSTISVGLLTNTATGGWKKDLSLLSENWTAGASNAPFFRSKPGEDVMYNMPTSGSPMASKSMFYPWAAYRNGGVPIEIHGPVTSWENLVDYALMYRNRIVSTGASGPFSITPSAIGISGDKFKYLHRVRVLPVIARIQWVFSYYAGNPPPPASGQPLNPPGSLEPRLLMTPVVTLWNPYNVQISMNGGNIPLLFNLRRPLPVAFKYTVGGTQYTNYNSVFKGGSYASSLSDSDSLIYQVDQAFTLKPGETRIFSPSANDIQSADNIGNKGPENVSNAGPTLKLIVGYRSTGGHYVSLRDNAGKKLVAADTATIKAEAVFDNAFNDGALGVGVYFDFWSVGSNKTRFLAYRMNVKQSVANEVYKPRSLSTSESLQALATGPTPFLTAVFGARMASKTHLAAKGFVQSSPLVNFTALGSKDETEATIKRNYPGTDHPVNSPFDYSFEEVAGLGDSLLPNAQDNTGRGYIVTGFNSADGLSRCVIAELPTRPLQSLAELQHWDLRYENPIPPFAFNLIGNSDATPLIASDSAVCSIASDAVNLQYDDSYCANHLLFDDWFLSSISPDPTAFGSGGRSLEKNYTDFVSGATPLGNNAYQPISSDRAMAAKPADAKKLYQSHVQPAGSWKMIASRLEVEGMFNVNSTSVTAWRALLRHAKDRRVPYLNETGTSWQVALSEKTDYAFSRFSVAGDVEAKSKGQSGVFPEAAEFSGYRILDDKMLDALATEIVSQVRQRGPFLSLSEFVNRQLSSGNLALAGTIQSALDQIAKKTVTNPYSDIVSVIDRQSSAIDPAYKFGDAAIGQATYGLPGWTRQADVLRALAPGLSVRDDTFSIRAYGSAKDKAGNIIATATCEATVRRVRDYVDSADAAEITTLPTKSVNQTFGRRFEVIAFRWLNPAEI